HDISKLSASHVLKRGYPHSLSTVRQDILGYPASLPTMATANHAYLCLDVRDCIIRPEIITFPHSSRKNTYQGHACAQHSDVDRKLLHNKVINDLKKCGYKKDNCELNYKFLNNLQPEWKQYGDVNDALGYKKKAGVVTSDPLALVAEKTKKAKVKDYNYYKTKMLLAKKDSNEQVLLAEDQAWMESSSDSDQEINANMVFMAQIEMVLSESDESSLSAEETIAEVKDNKEKDKIRTKPDKIKSKREA
nr:hypothetical protein [Tanacetum cinerariifolium]